VRGIVSAVALKESCVIRSYEADRFTTRATPKNGGVSLHASPKNRRLAYAKPHGAIYSGALFLMQMYAGGRFLP